MRKILVSNAGFASFKPLEIALHALIEINESLKLPLAMSIFMFV